MASSNEECISWRTIFTARQDWCAMNLWTYESPWGGLKSDEGQILASKLSEAVTVLV